MTDHSIAELRQKLLLTPKEFGLLIGVSESSARKIIKRDHIPTYDVYESGGIRISTDVAETWLARKKQEYEARVKAFEAAVRMPSKRRTV